MKTVRMPRHEYLKHFARDARNRYVGSEKQRDWTEEQLENAFGVYAQVDEPKENVGGSLSHVPAEYPYETLSGVRQCGAENENSEYL